jgi:predicted cupin superfamily sugar epimerase
MRISAATTTTTGLFLTALAATVRTSLSHECDNHDSLPTTADLVDLFGLERLEDGSYYRSAHRSSIRVIDDPEETTDTLTYSDAASVNIFLLTAEDNDFGWCWAECDEYANDNDSDEDYKPCWEDCLEDTNITYALSYFHRLSSDETWHFYFGDTIYLYELNSAATDDMVVTVLGADFENGEVLSHTIPAGTWFGAQVNPDSESNKPYALGATAFAPAFEEGDYEIADVTYVYEVLELEYANAITKIRELSFHPDKTDVDDDPYAEEGVNSLCHDEEDDDEEHEEMTLLEVVEFFGMEEGPKGGYYTESYRAEVNVITLYGGERSAMSSIYYAMNDTVFFHKQSSDETYHFHHGEPIILYEIDDTATPRVLRVVPIGSDVTIGEIPSYTVKAESWIALEFKNNNFTYWSVTNSTPYVLLGLTNGPGFDLKDLEFGVPEAMVQNFPEFASTINSLYDTGSAQESDEVEEVDIEDLFDDDIGCNMTGVNVTALNMTDLNMTEWCNANNRTFTGASTGANSQNFAAAPEKKSSGIITLYVLLGMACVAIIAFVVTKRRNDKEEDFVSSPDGITVVCERGGQIQNVEAISVAGKSRGTVSYIDFSGMIHQT